MNRRAGIEGVGIVFLTGFRRQYKWAGDVLYGHIRVVFVGFQYSDGIAKDPLMASGRFKPVVSGVPALMHGDVGNKL